MQLNEEEEEVVLPLPLSTFLNITCKQFNVTCTFPSFHTNLFIQRRICKNVWIMYEQYNGINGKEVQYWINITKNWFT